MEDKNLYVIAGCNGAGKTTASFTILPEIINCQEFINADEIAKGLSPFQSEKVAFEAGRIMLKRINELISNECSFAFETTLASRSYREKIYNAKEKGYNVTLLFFLLENVELAKARVASRVKEGGHNIPEDVIERRYYTGIKYLFEIYFSIVDGLLIFDNSFGKPAIIAQRINSELVVLNNRKFNMLKEIYDRTRKTN